MKNLLTLSSIILFLFFVSCEKEIGDNTDESDTIQKEKTSGYVQKGPFINGTSISIFELNSKHMI